jgi:hypothetical protein
VGGFLSRTEALAGRRDFAVILSLARACILAKVTVSTSETQKDRPIDLATLTAALAFGKLGHGLVVSAPLRREQEAFH